MTSTKNNHFRLGALLLAVLLALSVFPVSALAGLEEVPAADGEELPASGQEAIAVADEAQLLSAVSSGENERIRLADTIRLTAPLLVKGAMHMASSPGEHTSK